jgi:bifunctional enzyme CysN/CysC
LNEIGRCSLQVNLPICYDSYRRNRATGSFIVIDRISHATVAAGMILDRSTTDGRKDHWEDEAPVELHDERGSVTAAERHARLGQRPLTVLLTGLTGSGKTTTAYAVERRLFDEGRAVVVLDGQNLRRGISKDLGFTSDERSENLRRGAEVARLFNDAGIVCLAAFVAPDESVRQKVADVIGRDRFLVVHLDAPLEVCRQRDVDGHYRLAESGEITMFPGVSAPYDVPAEPDLVLHTDRQSVAECVEAIVQLIEQRGAL